jgi:probable HAF family extracellular repeat protein
MTTTLVRSLLTASLFLPPLLCAAQQIQYKQFQIPNSNFTEAIGINLAGDIVGFYQTRTQSHGFVARNENYFNLDDPEALAGSTAPKAINNAGEIVGTYRNNSNQERAFLYVAGTFMDIKAPGHVVDSEGNGINNVGQIVGMYSNGARWHAYVYDQASSTFQTIDVPDAFYTWGAAINDSGEMALFSADSQGYQHAWLYDGTNFTNIDAPGYASTIAEGINNLGQVTLIATQGCCNFGFVYDAGKFTPVDLPGAVEGELRGINDRGEIVGNFFFSGIYQGSFLALLHEQ